jgi:opacity protein-like surface antigen
LINKEIFHKSAKFSVVVAQGRTMKKSQFAYLLAFLFFQPILNCAATPYHWQGFYLGATAGSVFSHFNTHTSTQAGPLLDPLQANAVNHVGNQKINTSGFLGGIEGGYNWQQKQWLIGIETDFQSLSTDGETNSGAVLYPNQPGTQFVINSYGNNNWLLTARPRLGWITNNWLFYATGGLGLAFVQSDYIFSNNQEALESKKTSKITTGYVLGAGVETVFTKQVSLKAEYLFANFNTANAFNMNQHIPAGQVFSNSVKLQSTLFRVGVNYRFDDPLTATPTYIELIPGLFNATQWETETGIRLFYSSGTDGAPQPLLGNDYMPLISRLTFSDLTAISEEVFARVDHTAGLFAKGYLGAGSVTHGQLNDEDFPVGTVYSNTLSSVSGNLSYATMDLGYSFLKIPAGKVGAFVGYNYYAENLNAYGCKQLTNASVCTANKFSDLLGISEDDEFNSLRVGLTTQLNLTQQLTLTSEAAYLPIVGFKGTDIHNARQLIGPEQSSHGDGAMLETILNYQFSSAWNVGLGGRYWMWNMHSGSVIFDFLGQSETFTQPAQFNAERYGVFLQLSYHDNKSNIAERWAAPFNWQGVLVGGHLGGAWGESNWSDPFAATNGNIAGFGDQIRSTGALGGFDLNINWQKAQWVYGVSGSISTADIRGNNTLFSGIGGVNGKTITRYLGTIVGKTGIAFNRSLLYINGGRAVLNTEYRVNGNTAILSLGAENQTVNTWGWTGGIGIEHALTDHWSSGIEYDYIHLPSQHLQFPHVGLINNQRISASQNMNIFKVGVNYKI